MTTEIPDPAKWNAAVDAMSEIIRAPHPELRAQLRDEGCCSEFEYLKGIILKVLAENRR